MRAPEGYTLEKCCVASPRSEVYFARGDDGAEVVLKSYPDSTRRGNPHRLERELEVLRSLQPGVGPRALGLERVDEQAVLVLERIAGEAPRPPVPIGRFLPVAVGAANALGQIHAARIVHRNLRPENLWVSGSGEVRILGFGRAAPLGAPHETGSGEHALDGPLHYMSPEQTGRLERGVDFRSDLYALGATFYELLSGRPPFDARDPLDLIHAHIAHRARPLVEIAAIPATVSRIVMKLLEKEPEDRYQTAEALLVDLDTCREQLESRGAIDDELPLGTADAPYRPLFRRRIYGREAECAALQRAYKRSAQGEIGMLLVRGAPGVGKSALVPELHRPLALDGGYLARGKFDLYRRNLPYSGLTHALRDFFRQVSSESDARRESWRAELAAGLGGLAGVVAELIPELGRLLGETPRVEKLEPRQTQQRLALAVRRFVLTAARHAHPLVLFLDDLQWADAGSRYLLEELLLCGECAPLLVIGAYRDSEVGAEHPLQQLIGRFEQRALALETLTLGPLSASASREMLADALGQPAEHVRDLAERVSQYSGNNPLLIQQCIYHLHQLGCIRYAPRQGWTWDLEAADAAVIPDDPVGMMVAKLQRLRAETRSVVQLASCVGDQFDVGLLGELGHRERTALEAALYDLSDEGLIAPCGAGFRFVHDRIREAAQALLTESQRAQLHLRTAELLLQGLSETEQKSRCFEIADHLSRAAGQIPEALRLRAAEIHHAAGSTALSAGAPASASHYFLAGIALFGEQEWASRAQLGFDLQLQASECAYQMRESERALELLAPLEGRPLSTLQHAQAAAQRIRIYALSRSMEETLELTLASLRDVGRPHPRRPSWLRTRWEIARTDWILRGSPETWGFRPPESTDLSWAAARIIARAGHQAMNLTSARLMCLEAARMVRTDLRHGYVTTPGSVVMSYAANRAACLRHSRGFLRYTLASQSWLERVPQSAATPRARFLIEAYGRAWTGPRRAVLDPLQSIAADLRELGDIEYAVNSLLIRAHYMGLSGSRLDAVAAAFGSIPPRRHVTPIEEPYRVVVPYRLLVESETQLAEFSEQRPELERFAASAHLAATHWMLALCIFGRFADAWWASELVRPIIFERLSTTTHVADHTFFRGLAAAACAGHARAPRRWRLLRAAAESQRYLERWARDGSDFAHMATLLAASRAHAKRHSSRALHLYAQGAAAAEACGHVHHAALAHERRAELSSVLGRKTDADAARAQAIALYRAWGADAKVRALG